MRRLLFAPIALSLLLLPALGVSAAAAEPPPCGPIHHRAGGIWKATPTTAPWQWQLQGRIDTGVPACFYDVDGFETPRATVTACTAAGASRSVTSMSAAGRATARMPGAFPAR
jgi:hypothetical protein